MSIKLIILILISKSIYAGVEYPIITDAVLKYNCLYTYENEVDLKSYFYIQSKAPRALRNTEEVICHDKELYGQNDHPSIPRLNLMNNFLTVWDKKYQGFVDYNNNGKLDVHDDIADKFFNETGFRTEINIFKRLILPMGHYEGKRTLAFYLKQLKKHPQGRFLCPTQKDYDAFNTIIRILGEVIAVDTQEFYMAFNIDNLLTEDILYIGKDKIDKIWWYRDSNGQLKMPNKYDLQRKEISFYWPANLSNPYVKGKNQITYRIVRNTENWQLAMGCIPRY